MRKSTCVAAGSLAGARRCRARQARAGLRYLAVCVHFAPTPVPFNVNLISALAALLAVVAGVGAVRARVQPLLPTLAQAQEAFGRTTRKPGHCEREA